MDVNQPKHIETKTHIKNPPENFFLKGKKEKKDLNFSHKPMARTKTHYQKPE